MHTQPTPLSADALPLNLDNRFTRELPADPQVGGHPRQVPNACYSRVAPTPVVAPRLVATAHEVAALIGLDEAACQSDAFLNTFVGNALLPGMDPFAMCYGGHQFGNWAGQLGDGRAINLGEVINPTGQRWVLQLKGAGLTPYSRTADGLAVMRSSVREFLCSEAMHHLGVPTTRALSLIATGEQVVRDMFYDGNPRAEPGAVVCRVAPSFVRFGSFQIFASRNDIDALRRLADYTIATDFPHLGAPSREVYLEWFGEVVERTAEMIVHWMRVGFVHGVMNTDNMSILGQTIDYGPYGWLEGYDPDWTPNTTDAGGKRYRYSGQPGVAQWNLFQLANAILPLIGEAEPLQALIEGFATRYDTLWRAMMADKLGLDAYDPRDDDALFTELLEVLQLTETDMTLFYRLLAEVPAEAGTHEPDDAALLAPLREAYYRPEQLDGAHRTRIAAWLRSYRQRVQRDGTPDADRRRRMHAVNPKYVLRNYMAQMAAEQAETGDNRLVHELLELLRHPYDEQPGQQRWFARRPEWARNKPGCSMLSCSS